MTNYAILSAIYGVLVVLAAALTMAAMLRWAFRGKLIDGPAPDGSETPPGGMLNYAPPARRVTLLRRWPWLAGVAAVLQSAVLLAFFAGPFISAYLESRVYPAHFLCAFTGVVLTLGAVLAIARRGMHRAVAIPIAAMWPLRRLALATLGVVLILGAVLWGLLVQTERILEQWRADALRQTQRVRPTVPSGSVRARDLYAEAFTHADKIDSLPDGLGWPMLDYMPGDGLVPQFPESLQPMVAKLREAASLPMDPLLLDQDWSLDYNMLRSRFRIAAQVLRLHAICEARQGRITSAVADLQALRRVTECVAHSRDGLADGLRAWGLRALLDDAIAHVLPHVQDEKDLDALAREAAIPYRELIQASFLNEKRDLAALIEGDLQWITPRLPVDWPLWRVCIAPGEVNELRDFYIALLPSLDGDLPAAITAVRKLEAAEKQQPSQMAIAGSIRPTFVLAAAATLHVEARHQMLQLGILGARYRLRTGRLPGKLEDLVAAGLLREVPRDPFDGRPARMRVKPDEVVFYSIGYDLRDNGGKPGPSDEDPAFRLASRPLWELPAEDAPSTVPATQGGR